MSLDQLPVDVVLHILCSYLPLKTLAVLSRISKSWARFMQTNESLIYHHACVRYGFASSIDASFGDTQGTSCVKCEPAGWRQWCVRRFQLENAWLGKGPSTRKLYISHYGNVHRIKVDERAGYTITTYSGGGLVVSSIHDNRTLWSLPSGYVRPHAHCEYENGFLVFDRGNQENEVWRRAVDCQPEISPTASPPDHLQRFTHIRAESLHASPEKHGHFRPWALLNMPQFGRAFRFVYPTLLVASFDKAYLWNVVTATMEQTITVVAPEEMEDVFITVAQLNYVDVNSSYVFICSTHSLRVFDRTTGAMVWNLAAGTRGLDFYSNHRLQAQREEGFTGFTAVNPLFLEPYTPSSENEDFFYAVHVSPCGKHLAILFSYNRLLIIRDFQRLLPLHSSDSGTPNLSLNDIATEIYFTDIGDSIRCSSYLAFWHNRIAVACTAGVFVVNLDSPLVSQGDVQHEMSSSLWPNLVICSVNGFNHLQSLDAVSCLQLTEMGLFIVYDGEGRGRERKKVGHVDFAPC